MANQRPRKENQPSEPVEIGVEVAVLDLETDPFKEGRLEINPFVAGFYDGRSMEILWGMDCIPRLVALLKKCKPGTLVYAHNGGNFDFHFLLEFLPVEDCKFLCMGKRIVQIKLPWGVELRDSYAIIPKKLAAYGKSEIDYTWFEKPVRERHKKAICEYLKDDLRNNRNMVLGFLKRFPSKITLASSVFELLKKRFGYDPGRSSESYDSKFRPFFFGGRVQFWKLGELKGRFQIVDINSAYPWGMTQEHWFGFECNAGTEIPKKFAAQSFYLVECFSLGAFPARQKNGSVAFPHAAGRYYVTGWELLAAKELKLVKDLRILICYSPTQIKSMREFSQTLYDAKNAAKQRGDKEEEFFNKIAVNAGYGKLALNVSRFSEVKVTSLYDKPDYWKDNKEGTDEKPGKIISEAKAEKEGQNLWSNCWDDKDRDISFWKRSSYREGIDKFINVATAASITGCVRAFLLRSMAKCRDVVYCDTDSIIAADVSRLKMSDKLGDWKTEMNCTQVFIAGKKLYAATDGKKWKKACKGVNLSQEKIIEVARGKYQSHQSIAPTYSFFSKPKFVTREVKRADMPKREKKK
jgi:hypothetical protein